MISIQPVAQKIISNNALEKARRNLQTVLNVTKTKGISPVIPEVSETGEEFIKFNPDFLYFAKIMGFKVESCAKMPTTVQR